MDIFRSDQLDSQPVTSEQGEIISGHEVDVLFRGTGTKWQRLAGSPKREMPALLCWTNFLIAVPKKTSTLSVGLAQKAGSGEKAGSEPSKCRVRTKVPS
jgi:hypothetical protein